MPEMKEIQFQNNVYTVCDETARNAAAAAAATANAAQNALNLQQMANRKIIFLGDSYNTGWTPDGTFTPWGQIAAQRLGKTIDTDAFIVAVSGGAFGRPATDSLSFYYAFKEYGDQQTLAFRQSITDIVIGAGANEYNYTADAVSNGILRLGNYIAAYFPNAKVWLFAAGWNSTYTRRHTIALLYNTYSSASYYHGWIYNEVYPVLHDRAYMSSDLIHPNQNGQTALGTDIALIMFGGKPCRDSAVKTIMSGNTAIGEAQRIGKIIVCKFYNVSFSVTNISPTDITQTTLPLSCDLLFGSGLTNHADFLISGILRAASKFYNTGITFKAIQKSDLSVVMGLCSNCVNADHNNFIDAADVEAVQLKASTFVTDIVSF